MLLSHTGARAFLFSYRFHDFRNCRFFAIDDANIVVIEDAVVVVTEDGVVSCFFVVVIAGLVFPSMLSPMREIVKDFKKPTFCTHRTK